MLAPYQKHMSFLMISRSWILVLALPLVTRHVVSESEHDKIRDRVIAGH
jgi:hypothetical protein